MSELRFGAGGCAPWERKHNESWTERWERLTGVIPNIEAKTKFTEKWSEDDILDFNNVAINGVQRR